MKSQRRGGVQRARGYREVPECKRVDTYACINPQWCAQRGRCEEAPVPCPFCGGVQQHKHFCLG